PCHRRPSLLPGFRSQLETISLVDTGAGAGYSPPVSTPTAHASRPARAETVPARRLGRGRQAAACHAKGHGRRQIVNGALATATRQSSRGDALLEPNGSSFRHRHGSDTLAQRLLCALPPWVERREDAEAVLDRLRGVQAEVLAE